MAFLWIVCDHRRSPRIIRLALERSALSEDLCEPEPKMNSQPTNRLRCRRTNVKITGLIHNHRGILCKNTK